MIPSTSTAERTYAKAMAMYRLDPGSTLTRNCAEAATEQLARAATYDRIRNALPTAAGR